jgi:Polysaccharide biosynthesis enzyme WcbI
MATDRRGTVLVLGNCQAPAISLFLNKSPTVAERFRFVDVLNHAAPGHETLGVPPEAADADLLWMQYDERKTVPIREEVRKTIPERCRIVVFPPLLMMGFWPFAWADPRNAPEPGFPWGRYPWGDRIGLEISKLGLPAEKVFDAYMERSMEKMPDVCELVNRDRTMAERRDAQSDVPMNDYLSKHLLTSHLFWTWGHTSNAPLLELARRLFSASESVLGPLTPEIVREMRTAAVDFHGIGDEELPIHPEVRRRLGLRFCDAGTRYRWFGNRWNFREYITRYITFDRSW